MDDDVRAQPASGLMFQLWGGDIVLRGQAIVELKFRVAMPAVFKELVEKFAMEPRKVSKYRMTTIALGLVPPPVILAPATDERDTALCLPS